MNTYILKQINIIKLIWDAGLNLYSKKKFFELKNQHLH